MGGGHKSNVLMFIKTFMGAEGGVWTSRGVETAKGTCKHAHLGASCWPQRRPVGQRVSRQGWENNYMLGKREVEEKETEIPLKTGRIYRDQDARGNT